MTKKKRLRKARERGDASGGEVAPPRLLRGGFDEEPEGEVDDGVGGDGGFEDFDEFDDDAAFDDGDDADDDPFGDESGHGDGSISWDESDEGADLLRCVNRRLGPKAGELSDDEYDRAFASVVEADPRLRARLLVAESRAAESGDLTDDADETLDSVARADDLLLQALETDPGCIDALRLQALHDGWDASPSEDVATMVGVLRKAEERLTPEALVSHRGRLDELDDGPAYLRVRMALASDVRADGRPERAVRHALECRALSPAWFAPHEHLLAAWLLAAGRTADAREALARVPDEDRAGDVSVGWCQALADILDGRVEGDADRLLWSAVAAGDVDAVRVLDPDSEGGLDDIPDGPFDARVATISAWRQSRAAVEWLRRHLPATD